MFRRINLIYRSLLLLAVFSSRAVCDDSFGLRLTTENSKPKENTQYTFHYFVKDEKTGDYKTQKETKEGDSVHGSYTIAEPNGDLRTVTYKAGPGKGFEAKVDVQTSGSPMQTTDTPVFLRTAKTEKPTTLETNVSHFPGGFEMDISSKLQSDVKTEMGMKFSLQTNPVTESVTASTKATAEIVEEKTTEVQEPATETTQTSFAEQTTDNVESSVVESSTIPIEVKEISEDPIEKEIDEAINSMPKLPELVLSDNKTHFKFQKDPEEALLDERITQIARQLAETSLRREYEERKLGHFIPISVASIESSPATHVSKSFKFRDHEEPDSPSTLNVLTQLRLVPQYIYRQTLIPGIPQRLPGISKPVQKPQEWEQQTYESITNPPDILKLNKLDTKKISKVKEKTFSANYKTTDRESIPVMPIHVPTFFQFFTPYVMQKPQYATTVKKDLTKGVTVASYETLPYTPATLVNNNNTKKP